MKKSNEVDTEGPLEIKHVGDISKEETPLPKGF